MTMDTRALVHPRTPPTHAHTRVYTRIRVRNAEEGGGREAECVTQGSAFLDARRLFPFRKPRFHFAALPFLDVIRGCKYIANAWHLIGTDRNR